jgi:hypothetical protein
MGISIVDGNGGTDAASVGAVSKALAVTIFDQLGEAVDVTKPDPVVVSPVTAVDNDIIGSLVVSQYKFVSLQITGTFVATLTFQESNDNGTWSDVVIQRTGDVLNPYTTTVSTPQLVKIPTLAKYLRVRVSAYTSGIVEGVAFAYKEPNATGQISSVGELSVSPNQSIGLDAGTNVIGKVGLEAGTNTIGTVKVIPAITINPSYKNVISAVGVNSTLVQAGASNMGILHIVSTAATPRFFKFYNKATAPIVGTDIPLFTIALANGASPFTLPALVGIDFSLGLSFAILLGVEDDSTTPFTVAGEVTALIAFT